MKRTALAIAICLYALPAWAQQAVVGFESGPSSVVGTPANSSHAAGTAVGPTGNLTPFTNAATVGTNQSGLFVIPIMRGPGLSAIITQFALTSSGGSIGNYVVRIWRKLPINTTCIDGTAFAGNFTTDDADLITPPFSVAPAAPAVTTGDANTYASMTVQTFDAQNTDIPATRNLYVCLQTVSTDTADNNKPMRVMLSGPLN